MKINSKKGIELSLQTVVVLIIVLIVFIIMAVFFSEHFLNNSNSISNTGKDIINGSYS